MAQPERNVEQRGGKAPRRFPEQMGVGNLIWASPAALMRDNPAALVVNVESYNRIDSTGFDVELFDAPQVGRVRTYTSEGEEAIKLFVIDGNTRTKYAADHPDQVVAAFRYESIPVRDVTAAQLRSQIVVPESERREGQNVLSMVQYLRAVIPPTIEHAQIAPDRIAAYLINGWVNTVGEDLAYKFSAIAALSILGDRDVTTATDTLLRNFLSKQKELIAGETTEERVRLQSAILEMAQIVRQTRIMKEKIAESAFVLVASESQVIGGEIEALKQIYGLLRMPSIEQKLGDEVATHELRRQEIGVLLAEAFRKFADTPNTEQVITVLNQALRDPQLPFDKVREVLSAANPVETYHSIRQNTNVSRLEQAYLQAQRKTEISELEANLVTNLGRITYLEDRDIQRLVGAVELAVSMLDQIVRNRALVTQRREELQNSGVKVQTIADALITFDSAKEQIMSADTSRTLNDRANKSKTAIKEVEKKINQEIAMHRAGQLIDEVYGDRVQNGRGSIIRGRIASYLVTEFEKLDASNEVMVRQRVNQLASLDEDLQTDVVTGIRRLQSAINIQNQRRQPSVEIRTPVVEPPARGVDIGRPTTRVDVDIPPAVDTEEHAAQDRQAREERRKALNLERLAQAADLFESALKDIDLETGELTEDVKQKIDSAFKLAGKLRFSHPDIVRIMENYPRLLEENQRMRTLLHQREGEETSRDTRTRI